MFERQMCGVADNALPAQCVGAHHQPAVLVHALDLLVQRAHEQLHEPRHFGGRAIPVLAGEGEHGEGVDAELGAVFGGTAQGTVTIKGLVEPGYVAVTNGDYTFRGGAITGAAEIVKTGAGTLVLAAGATLPVLAAEPEPVPGDGFGVGDQKPAGELPAGRVPIQVEWFICRSKYLLIRPHQS